MPAFRRIHVGPPECPPAPDLSSDEYRYALAHLKAAQAHMATVRHYMGRGGRLQQDGSRAERYDWQMDERALIIDHEIGRLRRWCIANMEQWEKVAAFKAAHPEQACP